MIRQATEQDIDAIEASYDELRAHELAHGSTTNWNELYPTRKVPEMAVPKGQMFVLEEGGRVRASMMLNSQQGPGYDQMPWRFKASDDEVLVIHTLVVPPSQARHGYGQQMLDFAKAWGAEHACRALRIDTWADNEPAKAFYLRNGFEIVGSAHVLHWGVIDEEQVFLDCKL